MSTDEKTIERAEGEESSTREETTEALAQAIEEIDALTTRCASLERVVELAKVLFNTPPEQVPQKKRRVVRKREKPPPEPAAIKEKP